LNDLKFSGALEWLFSRVGKLVSGQMAGSRARVVALEWFVFFGLVGHVDCTTPSKQSVKLP
jgi:hypothetical protein